jgi:hypothetical protein
MCGFRGWPSDLFNPGGVSANFNKLTLQDVTSFVSPPPTKFNTTKGVDAAYNERWNLFNSGASLDKITLQDITALVTGARDKPPMFGSLFNGVGGTGTKAFNGPSCPAMPHNS